MNTLSLHKRVQILQLLIEGNSVQSTSRMAGASRITVHKLLKNIGRVCFFYQNEHLRNLPCKHIQCNEIWSFDYPKGVTLKNESRTQKISRGVWTWSAVCPDTKLVAGWHIGPRTLESASEFLYDLSSRIAGPVQLKADDNSARFFSGDDISDLNIDIVQLNELYDAIRLTADRKSTDIDDVDKSSDSTSNGNFQKLIKRISMHLLASDDNAQLVKLEDYMYAISFQFMYYNFSRIHETLKVTPAMKAGIADHVWSLEEIAVFAKEASPRRRSPQQNQGQLNRN